MTCQQCDNTGIRPSAQPSPFATETCVCEYGAIQRLRNNRAAINAYRLSGSEPITSASHAAQWDEMESAIDLVRDQHRHTCRGCDLTLPLGSKCGGYCERCSEEIQSQSVPAFKLTKWELRCLYVAAIVAGICIGLLIYSMCGGKL